MGCTEKSRLESLKGKSVGCIGCGTMGGATVRAIASSVAEVRLFVSAGHFDKAESFVESLSDYTSGGGATACESNLELAQKCDIVFIAVKPAHVKEVIEEIRPAFAAQKVLVSMAAGVSIATLRDAVSGSKLSAPEGTIVMPYIYRIMPNLPAVYGESMTALCAAKDNPEEHTRNVAALLATAGKVELIAEKLMDGVTAVSGSGPAYAFMFIEALADAAVKFGIPRKQAYAYAAQTLKGAAVMALEDERSISELKDAVCSPAGTTIEGVATLERRGFRGTVIEAATSAYNKSVELGKKG